MIIKNTPNDFEVRLLNKADYKDTHARMLDTTLARIANNKRSQADAHDTCNVQNSKANRHALIRDELWLVEHNDVYTLGQAGKAEHILQRNDTPIIKTDRGGQVTWHGKGQLVIYWLFDLTALDWRVRDLVSHAEQAIEDVVNSYLKGSQFYAKARSEAPGVYIYARYDDQEDIMLGKIASLGFKIKQGFSYHGIAININCDLHAFNAINPCGYAGMQMLRLQDFVPSLKGTDDLSAQQALFNTVAQAMVDNIAMRHRGDIKLR